MAAGIELRRHLRRCSDPRWDCGGFDAFVAHAAPFVTLGYLRERVAGAPFVELPTTPESELVRMLPEEAGIAGVAGSPNRPCTRNRKSPKKKILN